VIGRFVSAALDRLGPVGIAALVATAAALGWTIAHLGDRSLWFDELFTASLAAPTTPGDEAAYVISHDVHPPLYFASVRVWLGLLDASGEWAVRAFNVIGLALAIMGAAWAARMKVEAPMAVWSALFFTSFGVLWYLQEARMYAFLIFDCFLVCVVALVYEKLASSDARPTLVFIAATIAAFVVLPFMHWFAALFAGLVLLGLFALALLDRRRGFAILFLACGLALGGLAVMWIALFYTSTVGVLGDYDSGAGLELWQLRFGLVGTLLFTFTLNPFLIAAAAWVAFVVLRRPFRRPTLTLLVVCAGLVPVLILAASFHTPVNQTRNFVGFVGAGTLLAALGVASAAARLSLAPRGVAAGLAGLLAVSLGLGLAADRLYPKLERTAWREAGAYVRSLPGCDDAPIAVSVQWSNRPTNPGPFAGNTTRRKFAYYAGGYERFELVYRDDERLPEGAGAGACPVVFWVGLTTEEDAEQRARELMGDARDAVTLVYFPSNALFVRNEAVQPPP
jgi:hypothetical protein